MDFELLSDILPKQSSKWTVDDIKLWLQFIGLQSLTDTFKNAAIDGSCITHLSEEDLKDQLGIKSMITIKKLSAWIKNGIKQYDQFLKARGNQKQNLLATAQLNNLQNIIRKQDSNIYQPIVPIEPIFHSSIQEQKSNNRPKKQLIIQQCDTIPPQQFILREEGIKIGRHSSNTILILEQSVSRYHAEVEYDKQTQEFYLRDVGSTTGTFVKVEGKIQLDEGMILQMGSNQFCVSKIMGPQFILVVVQGTHPVGQQFYCVIKKNSDVKLGRKLNNQIHFPDDAHLSNVHCIFTNVGGKLIMQDNQTTNGTWLRLGEQGKRSYRFMLKDKSVFKMGTQCTYSCSLKTQNVMQPIIAQSKQQKFKQQQQMFESDSSIDNQNACNICYVSEKDCVFYPCKHNTSCIKCSKMIKQCPVCRTEIEDFIKIYHN